jgi:hypothetical protein
MISSWPAVWFATTSGAAITSEPAGRTATITIKWQRADIATQYKAIKAAMAFLRDGIGDELPKGKTVSVANVGQMGTCLGNVSGTIYGATVPCKSPVIMIQIVILDAQDKRVGAVTCSAKDFAEMIARNGKDLQKVGAAYKFE